MATILELVIQILKLTFFIIQEWASWKIEEQDRFIKRMTNVSTLLKEAIQNRDESFNELAYLSNIAWDEKQRYTKYAETINTVLTNGGGIETLLTQNVMGMSLRVAAKKADVVSILIKDLPIDVRSKMIAQLLAKN